MDRSEELRLPTIAVPVKLALVGGSTASAELFVEDVPRIGHSELLDDLTALLDDPTAFVPARVGSRVQLIAKHALRWVSIHKEPAEPAADREFDDVVSEVITLHDHQHHVSVAMIDQVGAKLEGTLLDSAPHDRPRAIDHLNAAGRFVRLWTSDEHYLINKLQILQVVELSGTAGGD